MKRNHNKELNEIWVTQQQKKRDALNKYIKSKGEKRDGVKLVDVAH